MSANPSAPRKNPTDRTRRAKARARDTGLTYQQALALDDWARQRARTVAETLQRDHNLGIPLDALTEMCISLRLEVEASEEATAEDLTSQVLVDFVTNSMERGMRQHVAVTPPAPRLTPERAGTGALTGVDLDARDVNDLVERIQHKHAHTMGKAWTDADVTAYATSLELLDAVAAAGPCRMLLSVNWVDTHQLCSVHHMPPVPTWFEAPHDGSEGGAVFRVSVHHHSGDPDTLHSTLGPPAEQTPLHRVLVLLTLYGGFLLLVPGNGSGAISWVVGNQRAEIMGDDKL